MDGKTMGDKEISVLIHSKKNDREESGEHFTNLYVKNIPVGWTNAELTDLFKEFGEITSVMVKEGTDSGFVMFKEHEQAQKAIEELNQKKEINGKVIFVMKHISRTENQSLGQNVPPIAQAMKETFKSNIYVRFIPKDVTDKEVEEKMAKVGKILSLKVRDNEQIINGEKFVTYRIGYVCYEDVREAQKCIQVYDQSNVFGYGHKPLRVDFWQSKFDLRHENEEKNINQVKKFIHFIQHEMQ
jgi:polyadenylate-binding protein